MKTIAYLSILFIFLYCFNSCTIEKRRYTNGYYVNWISGNHKPVEHINPKSSLLIDTSTTLSANANIDKPKDEEVNISKRLIATTLLSLSHLEIKRKENIVCKEPDSFKRNNFTNSDKPQNDNDNERILNIWALVSLLLSFTIILGVIAALIALGQFERNPGKYWGKGFAIATLIIVLLVFIVTIYDIASDFGQ